MTELLLLLVLTAPVSLGAETAPRVSLNHSSPWCEDRNAPARAGMYGDMGSGVGLSGPTHGDPKVFIDVPLKVASLFNQGLGQIWGFNRIESCRNFETAAAMDPSCALCHWGIAVCHGPNLQLTVGADDQQKINEAARKAQAIAHQQPQLTAKTKFLIASVMALVDGEPDGPPYTLRKKYAEAMCAPMQNGATDADIDAICGGALMSVSSWDYYTHPQNHGNFPLKPEVAPAKDRLLRAIGRGLNGGPHPLAIHYLIHLLEPTNAPPEYRWEALKAASELFQGGTNSEELVPIQGHLTHMPAHLFLRVGRYHDAVLTSKVAAANNLKYTQNCLSPYGYFHNVHMLIAGALLGGESYESAAAARSIRLLNLMPLDSMEALVATTFGNWSAVLAVPDPPPATTAKGKASHHYARAVALWAQGNVQAGDAEASQCRMLMTKPAGSPCDGRGDDCKGLRVAFDQELAAVRAWRVEKNATKAIAAYKTQLSELDSWPYYEPPGEFLTWYYPVRRCLGYALLAKGPTQNASAALALFEDDLRTFVNNSWSLLGAAQSLKTLNRETEAAQMQARATQAWKNADVPLTTPCHQLA